jgi:hypothetical protein
MGVDKKIAAILKQAALHTSFEKPERHEAM